MSIGCRHGALFRRHAAHGGHSGGFSHAPTMTHFHTKVIAKLGNEGSGHGRAPHRSALHGAEAQFVLLDVLNEGHPNGGDTCTDGDFF